MAATKSTEPRPAEAVCPECGVKFDRRYVRSVYCSEACRKRHKAQRRSTVGKVARKCKLCGAEFTVSRTLRKFCSVECAARYADTLTKELHRRSRRRKRFESEMNPVSVVHVCRWCGNKFERPRGSKNEYCSPECKRNSRNDYQNSGYIRRKMGVSLERAPARAPGFVKGTRMTCRMCGEPFAAYSSRSLFCSPTCTMVAGRLAQAQRYKDWKLSREDVKTCRHCGKVLPSGSDSCFCSHACLMAFAGTLEQEAITSRTYTCAECGRTFVSRCRMGGRSERNVYCSESCSKTANRRRSMESYRQKKESYLALSDEEKTVIDEKKKEEQRKWKEYFRKRRCELYGTGCQD